jgi:hypothetical protein
MVAHYCESQPPSCAALQAASVQVQSSVAESSSSSSTTATLAPRRVRKR